jgi:hypothetical protein
VNDTVWIQEVIKNAQLLMATPYRRAFRRHLKKLSTLQDIAIFDITPHRFDFLLTLLLISNRME